MTKTKKHSIAVIGASGYTGAELVRLLYKHPNVRIKTLVADSNAGKTMQALYPHFYGVELPELVALDKVKWTGIDTVFCCLPHATSQEIIAKLPKKLKIIDLSADFRIEDAATYEQWYGTPHQATKLQKETVYGLSEINRSAIKDARLVACPGCYPTSALLPLIPLLEKKAIANDPIIIDSKSGITGAGRSSKTGNLYAEVNEGVKAYGVCNHRHIAEIEQELSKASQEGTTQVHFTPQIVPMSRGILSTIYVRLANQQTASDLHDILAKRYAKEPFVQVLEDGLFPSTRYVKGTNYALMTVSPARTPDMAVIVCVIDNLTKGASGQAIQNFNIMWGLDETTGLDYVPQFP